MKHRSNYDWMLFLTSPMAFVGFEPTTSCSQSERLASQHTVTVILQARMSIVVITIALTVSNIDTFGQVTELR